jgi:hypothetical protein
MAYGPTQQAWPPVTANLIIQTLIYRLAQHPLLRSGVITDDNGNPIRITKFRNYDGLEVQNLSGLTLSVFPYHYNNSDQSTSLTVESVNASVKFQPYTLGASGDQQVDLTALDEATCNVVLRLHAFGFSKSATSDPDVISGQDTVFETNYVEYALRQYAELLAHALRGRSLRRLPRFGDGVPLLAGSTVQHIDFPTARWENKGNSVLHSASILWQAKYYVVREWRKPPAYELVQTAMNGNLLVGHLPDALGVERPIYYSTVRYKYFEADGETEIERAALVDPATGQLYPNLDASLISLIDTSPKSELNLSFYFRKIDEGLDEC